MASSPPDVFALVLGLPVVFVLVWFLARAVGGRWLDDPRADTEAERSRSRVGPHLANDPSPGSATPSDRAESPPHDRGLDRPEGTG